MLAAGDCGWTQTRFDGDGKMNDTKQRGYIDLDGFFVAAAVFLIALGIWVASLFGWLWPIVKALVHGVTA
jgi:hypothetical protein